MSIENLLANFENLRIPSSADTDSDSETDSLNISTVNNNHNLNNILSNNINSNMSQFKPEYLNCVPTFDGNPNDLNRYISTCQTLIDNFYNAQSANDFQNIYLLNSLISKLSGQAKLIINIQNVSTWDDLKDTLRRNFADQRDEACLNRDLVMMKQLPNEKPSQFYDNVLHILNLLCSFIDSHETTSAAKILKRNLYNDLALKTFLSGLKEPLGTTIRCMRPQSLMQAFQFVSEEHNVNYFQNQTKSSANTFKNNNNFKANNHANNFHSNFTNRPFFNQQNPQYAFRPNFPSQPVNVRPSFNRPPQKYFTNSQVFGKSGSKPNYAFRPNQQKQFPAPTPMSGVETSKFKPFTAVNANNNNSNNYNPPKFGFEELYNAETQNLSQYEQNDQYYYQDQPYDCFPSTSAQYFESNFEQNDASGQAPDHDLTQQYYLEETDNNENFQETLSQTDKT